MARKIVIKNKRTIKIAFRNDLNMFRRRTRQSVSIKAKNKNEDE